MVDLTTARPLRLALIAEGDAETRDCWSGSALGFVTALRDRGVDVTTLDVDPKSWHRWLLALGTLRPGREAWHSAYNFSALAFRVRSGLALSKMQQLKEQVDAIVQIGATFETPARELGLPLVVYIDANVRMAERASDFASVNLLPKRVRDRIAAREHAVYHSAQAVWTMSNYAARSIVSDFGVPEERVRTLYAGPNSFLPNAEDSSVGPSTVPRVLFVGKDFKRKGLDTLLAAFRLAHERVPDAELHVVGASLPSPPPGVTYHGFVPWNDPEGRTLIRNLFRTSTVMCMPSRYEPFGVAFVEAMHMGVPCIGTNRWAMPEIIEQGSTGWLVPDDDVAALAGALTSALEDLPRSADMGKAARERARKLFTWDAVAGRAVRHFADLGVSMREGTARSGAER